MSARKRRPDPPMVEIKEFRTVEEIDRGITKLKRRIEEVKALDPEQISYRDQVVNNTVHGIRDTILEIFGNNSPEYRAHGTHRIFHGYMTLGMGDREAQRCFADGIPQTVKMLEGLVARLEERRAEMGEGTATRVQAGFEGLNLHPEIYSKCHSLHEAGAYAEAVERGFKVVRDRLRRLTGHETGSEAFGKGRLYIRGAAAPHVDRDFNEAVKFLTMAIDRFRNEKSHTSDAHIADPVRAYEYLRLSSLAMNLLENAEIQH